MAVSPRSLTVLLTEAVRPSGPLVDYNNTIGYCNMFQRTTPENNNII